MVPRLALVRPAKNVPRPKLGQAVVPAIVIIRLVPRDGKVPRSLSPPRTMSWDAMDRRTSSSNVSGREIVSLDSLYR